MVKIRLARSGAKKRPFYHVVATDSRNPRDSHYIERLGYYNPKAVGGEQKLVIDMARIEHWTSKGAQVSDRVTFLVRHVPNGTPEGAADAKADKSEGKPKGKAKAKSGKKAEQAAA